MKIVFKKLKKYFVKKCDIKDLEDVKIIIKQQIGKDLTLKIIKN